MTMSEVYNTAAVSHTYLAYILAYILVPTLGLHAVAYILAYILEPILDLHTRAYMPTYTCLHTAYIVSLHTRLHTRAYILAYITLAGYIHDVVD